MITDRITKTDIENYKPQAQPATGQPQAAPVQQPAASSQTQSSTAATAASFEEIPVSQMRKTIARRLSESLFTAPHFYITMTIDMDSAMAARTRINELSKVKISLMILC